MFPQAVARRFNYLSLPSVLPVLHTAHCTLQIAQMHTAELHGMQASVAGQCRLILVLHCTVVLIISVLVVWVMAEQLNFPKNIARQSSSLSPNIHWWFIFPARPELDLTNRFMSLLFPRTRANTFLVQPVRCGLWISTKISKIKSKRFQFSMGQ